MASLGIGPLPNSADSDVLVTLALTLEGSQVLGSSGFSAPIAVAFTAGALSFRSDPALFGMNIGIDAANLDGHVAPLSAPILGTYQPGGLHFWFDQLQPPVHGDVDAMFTSFLLAPPGRTTYCLAFISGDCDVSGGLDLVGITRHQVPESASLVLLLNAIGLLTWKYSRARGRHRRSLHNTPSVNKRE